MDIAPARRLAKELAATTSNMLEVLQRERGLRELRSQCAVHHKLCFIIDVIPSPSASRHTACVLKCAASNTS